MLIFNEIILNPETINAKLNLARNTDHVLVPERKDDVSWLQSELTRADRIISQGYSLSAKYFLRKRGLQIEINSRKTDTALSDTQIQALDKLFNDVQWRERLGINERYH